MKIRKHSMLKFISFGSGSSGNCYLLFTETDALMIDAGVGTRMLKRRFGDYGLSLSSVHNIIITHDHADHVKSVGVISHERNAPVYATAKVHEGIRHNYCVRHKIEPQLARTINKGETIQIGEFTVTPFNVPHDSQDNVGYCIVCGGVNFCIITDAGTVTEEMKPFIAKANHLVIEANHDEQMLTNGHYPQHLKQRILSDTGHLSNANCAKALVESATSGLRNVWLCHLSEENNHPELARKTVEEALLKGGFDVGGGLKLTVLKRTIPSGIYELT